MMITTITIEMNDLDLVVRKISDCEKSTKDIHAGSRSSALISAVNHMIANDYKIIECYEDHDLTVIVGEC